MDRASADYMGMLATVINALAMQDALEKHGVATRVQSAIEMQAVAEPYIRRRAMRHLEKGRVVIFGAGTGNPYFTTDTAASSAGAGDRRRGDPQGHQGRRRLRPPIPRKTPMPFATRVSPTSTSSNAGSQVMDATAISLCMDNNLPIIVFDLNRRGNIRKVVCGEQIGTLVKGE